MKYISLQDLVDHGNELRFQSAEQMAKVYEELPSITIIHCRDCKWWDKKDENGTYGYCHAIKHSHYSRRWEINIHRTYEEDFFCADAELRTEKEEEEQ